MLGLATALLVARPIVLGEDPGLLSPLSDTTSMVLTLGWFLAALLALGGRLWTGQNTRVGGGVESGLLLTSAAVFLSAGLAAAYKHPAWLVASEWLVLVCVFGLGRLLTRDADDRRYLLAVLLASGVSSAAYATYQYTVEMPALRKKYGGSERDVRKLLADGRIPAETGISNEGVRKRLMDANVYGTFAHPNTFAGYLGLLFPPTIAAVVLAWRRQGRSWRTLLLFLAALVVALALWWTHSRGVILGTLLVGGMVLAFLRRDVLWPYRWWAGGGLLLVVITGAAILGGLGAGGVGKAARSFALRLDYWQATVDIIRDHPWLGVGPGNFGRIYPAYMVPTAYEKIQDPHNFFLEMWATSGLLGLVALIGTLFLLFREIGPGVRGNAEEVVPDPSAGPRWEFYLGGALGLFLGFALRAAGVVSEDLLAEGVLSAMGGLIWFGAFALFLTIPWSGAVQSLTLGTGLLIVLVNLLISGGLMFPSLMQIFWFAAALAIPAKPVADTQEAGRWPLLAATGLVAGVTCAWFVWIFQPVTSALADLNLARSFFSEWEAKIEPAWRRQTEAAVIPLEKVTASQKAEAPLRKNILEPLDQARATDPGNAQVEIQLANGYGQLWRLFPGDPNYSTQAVAHAARAQELDPHSKDGFQAEYQLRLMFAQRATGPQRLEQQRLAAVACQHMVERDPTEAVLRLELAECLQEAADEAAARRAAQEALRLDALATMPVRLLSPAQRERARQLAGETPGTRPPGG